MAAEPADPQCFLGMCRCQMYATEVAQHARRNVGRQIEEICVEEEHLRKVEASSVARRWDMDGSGFRLASPSSLQQLGCA